MRDRWNPPYPKDREPNWYERSCWAERDWQAALERFWDDLEAQRRRGVSYEDAKERVGSQLSIARTEYRRRVLGWYRKLCLPMEPGDCVPNTVAELLAEEEDLERGDGRAVEPRGGW